MNTRFIHLVTALLLSGCGFNLVGSRPLPSQLQYVYIDATAPYRVSEPPIETALRSLLQRRGGQVLDGADLGATVIKLSDINETRVVLSIGTDSKALEYQIGASVNYSVFSGDKMLANPDTINVARSFSFNPQAVLAKEAEEARLREYLQKELAELLLLRLDAVFKTEDDAQVVKPDVVPLQ